MSKKLNNLNFTFKWQKKGSVIYGDSGTKSSNKVLGLDMDATIIKVISEFH
jgi:hypothetical protein